MAKNRTPWNKGREVGQMLALAPGDVERIRQVIGDRGPAGHRDLALFNLAIDTMISVTELLNLTVKDVKSGNGSIRSVLEVPRSRGQQIHRCALSKATILALKDWLASSRLKGTDFLFPGRGGAPHPLAARNLSRLIKEWTAKVGLDPIRYGMESLRRTKAVHILNSTGDLDTVRILLGHTKIESTARFLRISRKAVDPLAVARAHDF